MTNAVPTADDRLDLVFQALSNRTRRALLETLKRGPAKVTDLAKPFGMSLNAVSKHLMALERAGLVRRSIAGREHMCALEAAPMATAEAFIGSYEAFWSGQIDRFATYVENLPDE